MKNKIRLAIGWFGVLTPVYAAGALTVLLAFGVDDILLIGRIVVVSAVNCFVGYKILKMKLVEKGAEKYGRNAKGS